MGTLSPNDKTNFESQMNQDPDLQKNVDLQKSIMEGIQRMALKTSTQNAYASYKLQAFLTKLILIVVIAAGVTFGVIKMMNSTDDETSIPPTEYNEKSFTFPENDSLSADANQYLEQEFFSIKTDQDTLVETKDGIVIYIPANAFNTTEAEVDLLIQGAITAEDILTAGLSTITADGQELETGGMFYIDAYVNGERVDLLKEITVDVPTNEKKSGMELYDGEKNANGEIVWNNPKPIEKFLTPVEITSLDFYPPDYENKLNEMGYSEKGFMDSLYYSFACDEGIPEKLDQSLDSRILSGRLLFGKHCASCHFPDAEMTGPKLSGARERWIQNSSEKNFYAYIKNSVAVIASGDKYANKLHEKYKTIMTPQNLNNQQIDDIFIYADNFSVWNSANNLNEIIPDVVVENSFQSDTAYSSLLSDYTNSCPGINPANIKTIWNSDFNNTNLATKEFEERMPWIHKSCNNDVLNLYLNNLDKPLSTVDSMAFKYLSGEVLQKFKEFALRGDGRVEVDNDVSKKLANHYETKRKAFALALKVTQENYWNEQLKKDNKNLEEENKSNLQSSINQNEIFQKEFKKNLCKVYDKLDLDKDCNAPPPPTAAYTVRVNTLGWKNIDVLVFEATMSRTTTTFSEKGKTSTLTYNEWSATIIDFKNYDRVNVYNIPVEFNSYIKLPGANGKYEYKLNADLQYQTVVLAWTADGIYFYKDQTTKGDHTITMKKVSDDEWKNEVRTSLASLGNMSSELDHIEFAQKDQKRINTNKEKQALRQKIEPVVFPCGGSAIVSPRDEPFHSGGAPVVTSTN